MIKDAQGWIGLAFGLAACVGPLAAQQPSRSVYDRPVSGQRLPAQNPPQARVADQRSQPSRVAPGQPVAAPAASSPQPAPRQPLRAPFTINAAHAKYLHDVLKFWEFKSGQIKRFRCDFERWEFNPDFGPKDPSVAMTRGFGEIKYLAPDKGMFKVNEVRFFTPPQAEGEQASYQTRPGTVGEHWVCDGAAVFEYKPLQKVLVEQQLPPEMQGKAIADGPLPFLFGAKADELTARYWMRVITPKQVKNQYWIEAYPKRREDAANYKRVTVILSATDFLPDAIEIYLPNGRSRTVFQFTGRKVNDTVDSLLSNFQRAFYQPVLPPGWRKVVHDLRDASPPANARRQEPATQR